MLVANVAKPKLNRRKDSQMESWSSDRSMVIPIVEGAEGDGSSNSNVVPCRPNQHHHNVLRRFHAVHVPLVLVILALYPGCKAK